jgi:tripartite-type tricarboxylate transporter receptor subunit TctC
MSPVTLHGLYCSLHRLRTQLPNYDWGNAGNAINASLYHKLNFNFLHDLVTVAGLVRAPHVLFVTPSFPAKTVAELIILVWRIRCISY